MRHVCTPDDILRFPLPFTEDRFTVRVGMEAHDRQGEVASLRSLFDVDASYLDMVAARAAILAADPSRWQSLPHMIDAQWEALELILSSLAQDFPGNFTLKRDGARLHWQNRLLRIDHVLALGDRSSLPIEPLAWAGMQMQGDLGLFDLREGGIFMDAALVTEAFHWSSRFVFGMEWQDLHGPVQGRAERGVIDRAARMIGLLQPHAPQRRVNWGTQTGMRLDMSMENRLAVNGDRMTDLPRDFVFRTELQHLHRLPRTGAVLFCLRNYLARIEDLVRVRKWAIRLHRVFRDFDPGIERYGFIEHREDLVAWLARFDDGRALSAGREADQAVLDPHWRMTGGQGEVCR